MTQSLLFPLIAGIISIAYAIYKTSWVKKQDPGNEKLQEISLAIRNGATAFMKREYKILFIMVISVAVILGFTSPGGEQGYWISLSYIVGAVFSALAGWIGMNAATLANCRTAHGARTGIVRALNIAFAGGSVMGLCVVGLGLLGVTALTMFFLYKFGYNATGTLDAHLINDKVLEIVTGYSLGASSVALIARVGGGIFTKAADVGADLVGKVEAGIPEDDPRNPAVIADNVGDNVGDVAGLGSDLCESYIATIIGAMVLGAAAVSKMEAVTPKMLNLIILPLILAAVGIVASIIGTFFVRMKEGGNPHRALNFGTLGASALTIIIAAGIIKFMLPDTIEMAGKTYHWWGVLLAITSGLVSGVLIGIITEYYTADDKAPVKEIARQSQTGAATNIIAGLQTGMLACGWPVVMLVIGIYCAYMAAGLYGIAIAALGMLATTGIQLAVDAYGPIADNAGGLAEMAKLPPEVRERTDKLDAVGNTTAAVGKGFAIGSAAFTALALFIAFKEKTGLENIDVTKPEVVCGLLIGGMLPYVFSSFVIGSVGKAAFKMIEEVRRQFREIKGILDGTGKPDYVSCVDIATKAAIKEMIVPSVAAVIMPVLIGFLCGSEMLGGMLVGCTVSAVMLALFMANAGGAWDNAKKHIESGAFGGKGSDAHKASVIGDTVGDPFKDTAGPAMDIIIKLMSVVALVIAPSLSKTGFIINLFK